MTATAVSLFAGIGGFDLALARQGVTVTAAVEIDSSCQQVLARHFPETTLFTDVREITGADLIKTGFEPATGILTAGWPCQGNSVAGRRAGMADPRSGLWREVARLLDETRPRYFIGENVPGLLTVNGGRDFGFVKESLEELGYGLAWRVLDAQNFGVPQRRRRVIIVGCLGDGASPAEILLEPESGIWDSTESPQAGARVAGALAASAGGGGLGGVGQSANAITSRIVEVVSTLQGGGKRGYRIDAEGAAGGHIVPVAMRGREGGAQIEYGEPGDPAFTIRTPADGGSYPMACVTGDHTHALTTANNGKNSSEDGTGRGVPIVTADPAYALTSHHGRDDRENNYVVGFNTKESGGGAVENLAPTLRAESGDPHMGGRTAVAGHRLGVRRLTPRECERLQGFPDDWTAGQSDSARYRQLGNAVAVPVVEWIARRIVASDRTSNREAA